MATPITDVVRLLKENRASQRERRAADKDVILALTKIDTDKEIRLLSTQIEYMDRERRDIDKNIAIAELFPPPISNLAIPNASKGVAIPNNILACFLLSVIISF